MKQIHLIITDIDGTLLNSERQISNKTKEFLLDVQKQGTKIALCSGRIPAELKDLEKELQLDQYEGFLIHTNGSGIINCKTKKEVQFSPILLNELKELIFLSRKWHLYPIIEFKDSYITECRWTTHFLRSFIHYCWPKNKKVSYVRLRQFIYMVEHANEVDDVFEYIHQPINKIIFKGLKKNVDKLNLYIQNHPLDYTGCRITSGSIEVNHASVDKGKAILYLMDLLNIDNQNVICFGDSANDHSMFRILENSVAMKNADDKTKALAKYITDTNDEDGIITFLGKYSTF